MEQIGIALLGVSAIWLSQDTRPAWRRWACICGLCAQPFWFFTAWTHDQWGILALCFLYGASWMRGVWNQWIKPKIDRVPPV